MNRKDFLKRSAVVGSLSLIKPFNILSDITNSNPVIDKITIMRVPGEFYRSIAMNAYDNKPKGKTGSIRLIRVIMNDGRQGLGVEGYSRINKKSIDVLQKLIGKDPQKFYNWSDDQITGFTDTYRSIFQNPSYAFMEAPILDILGKVKNVPVWKLFAEPVRSAVDCYDGTLYFKDIELNTDVSVIADLARRIKNDGYKAIKMKMGRPYKWLKGKKGVERDIEAFIAARDAVGSNFNLMADANNGYREHYPWAIQLLKECFPYEMFWIEEIFPEKLEKYKELYQDLNKLHIPVRIAEGESVKDVERFKPFLENHLYHVIQPDMRTTGFSNILHGAELASSYNRALVPHNWQSEMGKIMSIHASMIKENILFAEDDRYQNFAIDSSNYLFRDGQWIPPKKSGWGIELNKNYNSFQKIYNEKVIN